MLEVAVQQFLKDLRTGAFLDPEESFRSNIRTAAMPGADIQGWAFGFCSPFQVVRGQTIRAHPTWLLLPNNSFLPI